MGRQLLQEEEQAKERARESPQTPPDAGRPPRLTYDEWVAMGRQLRLEDEQAKERARERKDQEDVQKAAAKAKPHQEHIKKAS
jgi:hypothetical protein